VYTILMEDEMDGTGLRNVYTILMEDEMDGTGLRNVYTILMENLKGRHTSPPPFLEDAGKAWKEILKHISAK